MAYPARYRQQSSALKRSIGKFIEDRSGFIRFPDGRGTWQNPTRPVGRPVAPNPLLPTPEPTPLIPPDPATRRQQDIPWWERNQMSARGRLLGTLVGRALPWALLAYELYDMVWPTGPRQAYLPPPAGWVHVCGPFPYPGPPYKNEVWTSASPVNTTGTCLVPAPLQALSNAGQIAPPGTRTIIYAYGPNVSLLPTLRYFTFDQYSINPAPVPAPVSLSYYGQSLPAYAVPLAPPGAYNVLPITNPVSQAPARATDPITGVVTRSSPSTGPSPDPRPSPGGLHRINTTKDVRPRDRERERKVHGWQGAVYKAASQFGTWHSFIDALWRSLPPRYSHRKRSFQGRLEDIYLHFDEIRWEKAVRELLKFWVAYKVAGFAYGRAQQEMVRLFGPRRGPEMYRHLVRIGAI